MARRGQTFFVKKRRMLCGSFIVVVERIGRGQEMGNKIIQLDDHRPHLMGKVRCLNERCGHEAVAVAPVGSPAELECSKCGLMQAVFIATFEVSGTVFLCKCGCDVFRIGEHADKPGVGVAYCIKCTSQQGEFLPYEQ